MVSPRTLVKAKCDDFHFLRMYLGPFVHRVLVQMADPHEITIQVADSIARWTQVTPYSALNLSSLRVQILKDFQLKVAFQLRRFYHLARTFD
jgi:hypothetical protein